MVVMEIEALEALVSQGRFEDAEVRIMAYEDWRLRRHELSVGLLQRARAVLPGDPEASFHWARLAEVAAGNGDTALHLERQAQAIAYKANARRAVYDFTAASRLFEQARRRLSEEGITTPVVASDVDLLESSLARDLGNLERSEDLARRAVAVESAHGTEAESELRALISLSIPLLEGGQTPSARRLLQKALPRLASPSLRRLTLLNLCLCGIREESYRDARKCLTRLRQEARGDGLDAFTASRIRWVEARVSAGLGAVDEAVDCYRDLFEEFLSRHGPHDALLVALDWLRLAKDLGRDEDLAFLSQRLGDLARRAPEFHEATREAVALLVEIVVERAFTEQVYWQFEKYFWRTRRNPEQRIGM